VQCLDDNDVAELYSTGVHRISYQSIGFREGVDVTGRVWGPTGERSELQIFDEIGEGLYYLDYDFIEYGVHTAITYENGIKKKSGTYRVQIPPGIVTHVSRGT